MKSIEEMDPKGKRMLGVFAHPDDLEFAAGGTISKWIEGGAEFYYLVCTDGSLGTTDPSKSRDDVSKARREEELNASRVLGVKDLFFLNHRDTELMPDSSLKKEIVRYVRMLKPDLVMTTDPSAIYYPSRMRLNHADHRAAGLATIDAVFPLARKRSAFEELEEEGLAPHRVSEIYITNSESFNMVSDISGTIEKKLAALAEHKSQVNELALERVRGWAEDLGKKTGKGYAEGFVRIIL